MKQTAKQVIVMRTDLGMRAGKALAQASHAAQEWLVDRPTVLSEAQASWLGDGLKTIIVKRVKSEAELLKLYKAAQEAGLTVHLVTDVGLTVFDGVMTHTCLSIGPHFEEDMAPVIKRLQNLLDL